MWKIGNGDGDDEKNGGEEEAKEMGVIIHRMLTADESVMFVFLSPDSNIIVSGEYDGRITIWDATSYARVRTFKASDRLLAGLMTPCGRFIVAGLETNIEMWSVR